MIYKLSARFEKSFDTLPKKIQTKVLKALKRFQDNPKYPSLRIKKMEGYGGKLWEGRVDRSYRFTFEYFQDTETGEDVCYFRNVGTHDILDKSP